MLRDVIEQEIKKVLRFTKSSGPNNLGGPCPFHKGGMEKTPSFFINLNNGLFICHACGVKGTFIQLLKLMKVDSRKIAAITDQAAREQPTEKPERARNHRAVRVLSEALLGAFDYCPIKLVEDGFDKKLLRQLDVGFDRDKHRITFPIRDSYGNLVGFSGRTVKNAIPRYLVYREQDLARLAPEDEPTKYRGYEIKNHDYLWNMHNVYPSLFYGELNTVIVVEGFKACIWMLQHGFDNTVALMGSRMTASQESLLTKFSGAIFLFLDANTAGSTGTLDTGKRLLSKGQEVWVVEYPEYMEDNAQPDNLDQEELQNALDTALTFTQWRIKNGLYGRSEEKLRPSGEQLREFEGEEGRF